MVFSAIPQVITEDRASGAHIFDGSLKIDNDKSQYLRKTFSNEGNRRTFTWSCWVKRSSFGDWQRIFTCEPSSNLIAGLSFTGAVEGASPLDAIRIQQQDSGSNNNHFRTTAAYRDTGWYHIVMRVDTTLSTADDRVRLYVNGELQPHIYPTGGNPGLHSTFGYNSTSNYHEIGHSTNYNAYYDGQITQCHWLDGIAVGPEEFGYTDPLTNTWRPKKYTGSFNAAAVPGATYASASDGKPFVNTTNEGQTLGSGYVSGATTNAILLVPGYNLTEEGSSNSISNINATSTTTSKWYGNAIQFGTAASEGNVQKCLSYSTALGLSGASNFTFEAWVYPRAGSSSYNMLFEGDWQNNHGIRFSLTSAYKPSLQLGNGGFQTFTSDLAVTPDQWSHVAIVCDNNTMRFFVNGTMDVKGTRTMNYTVGNGHRYIGAYRDSNHYGAPRAPFYGYMQDIRLTSDVKYNASFTVPGGGAVPAGVNGFYLPMDGSAPVGKDQSGNGNDFEPFRMSSSASLDKATGAIPILNTSSGGTQSTGSVRTDIKSYTVTASGGKYYLDGALTPTLNAYRGSSLTFDYTGATSHPLYLSSLPDGKWNSKAYSVAFDGTGDALRVPDHEDFRFGTGAFTVECYVWFNSFDDNYPSIISKYTGGTASWIMRVRNNGAAIYYSAVGGGSNEQSSEGIIKLGKWHHIAMVREGTGSNQAKMYVDGALVLTATDPTDYTDTQEITIGAQNASDSNVLNGYMSNVRIIKGTALYTSEFTPPGTTLTNVTNTKLLCCQDSDATTAAVIPPQGSITVAGNPLVTQTKQPFLYDTNHGNFGLNTTTSNTTKITIPHLSADTLYYYCNAHGGMGSSINVTTDLLKADPYAWKCVLAAPLSGAADDKSTLLNVNSVSKILGMNGPTASTDKRNFYGSHYNFDGNDHIAISDHTDFDFGSGDFTVEAWVERLSKGNRTDSVVFNQSTGGASSNSATYFGVASNGVSLYLSTNGTSWTNNIERSEDLGGTNKPWHHIVWQRKNDRLEIWIDGTRKQTGAFTGTINNSSRDVEIGRQNGASYYNGQLQDLRVYKGLAKYTESFIPASVDPSILPDSPSGIPGKTNLTKITDGGVYFDRSGNDYLQAPASTDFRLDGQYCIEYFLNLTDYSNDSVYVRTFVLDGPTGDGGTTNIHLNVNPSNGVLLFWSGGGELISGTISIAGSWHHVCLTRDSSNKTRLFIDGVLSGSADIATDYNLNSNQNRPRLGALGTTGGTTGHYSNWRITKGSIPTEYQTSTTTNGTRAFSPPTETLTTTSQGATANDVKLIACQSNTEASSATVAPNVSGVNNGTEWSKYLTGGGGFQGSYPATNAFNGVTTGANTSRSVSSQTTQTFIPPGGISYSSSVEVWTWMDGTVSLNGGSNITVSNDQSFREIATGSGTINNITFNSASGNSIYIAGIRVDGTILLDPLTTNGGAEATNFNPFIDDINAIRGKQTRYATLDPYKRTSNQTLSDGNLRCTQGGNVWGAAASTIGMHENTGKFYFECTVAANQYTYAGIANADSAIWNLSAVSSGYAYLGGTSNDWGYLSSNGNLQHGGSAAGSGARSLNAGDTIGITFDTSNKECRWYVEGELQYTRTLTGNYPFFFASGSYQSHNIVNFGQKPFKFLPSGGFQPVNISTTQPEKVFVRPEQYVSAITYSGNNSTSNTVTDLKFNSKPDFVWIKSRSGSSSPNAQNHYLMDSVRGANGASGTSKLYSNNNGAANSGQTATTNGVRFIHNGFELTTNNDGTNSNNNYVAWCWKAGGSEGTFNVDGATYATAAAAGLSAGTMTVTGASVGTKQGFSIVRYTGSGSAGSLAHGLGQKPTFWIVKSIDAANYPNWYAYTEQLDGSLDFMHFHTNEHKFDSAAAAPTSTTIGITSTLGQAVSWITYMWHDVPGLQKFGSFTGNSSHNFVELGFRPAIVWVKRAIANSSSDTSTNNSAWTIMDSTRLSYNGQTPNHLYANHTVDEGKRGTGTGTTGLADMTLEPHSNGFYLNGPATETNSNTGKFIYCAWAESPASNLYGGQSNAR